jgi:hypothetical protein
MRLSRPKTSTFLTGLVVVVSLAFVLLQVDQAQAGSLGNKSVRGRYTMQHRNIGGLAPGAAGGFADFDGAGNITNGRGFFSGDFGSGHEVLEVTKLTGTYNIKTNGTGTGTVTYYIKVGGVNTPVAIVDTHLVITVRKKLSTYDKALEIYVVSDELDLNGSLDAYILKKW